MKIDVKDLPLEDGVSKKYLCVTMEQAKQVRKWRVDEGWSWRGVAGRYWDEYGIGDSLIHDNQCDGMEICCVAAYLHGENFWQGDWNSSEKG